MHCTVKPFRYGVERVESHRLANTNKFYQLKKEHFMHFHSLQSNQVDLACVCVWRWRFGPLPCDCTLLLVLFIRFSLPRSNDGNCTPSSRLCVRHGERCHQLIDGIAMRLRCNMRPDRGVGFQAAAWIIRLDGMELPFERNSPHLPAAATQIFCNIRGPTFGQSHKYATRFGWITWANVIVVPIRFGRAGPCRTNRIRWRIRTVNCVVFVVHSRNLDQFISMHAYIWKRLPLGPTHIFEIRHHLLASTRSCCNRIHRPKRTNEKWSMEFVRQSDTPHPLCAHAHALHNCVHEPDKCQRFNAMLRSAIGHRTHFMFAKNENDREKKIKRIENCVPTGSGANAHVS